MKIIKKQIIFFKHLQTIHKYHLVDPSPWPVFKALGGFCLTVGGVFYMHKFKNSWLLLLTGFFIKIITMLVWWQNTIKKLTFENCHSKTVQKKIEIGNDFFYGMLYKALFFICLNLQ
jgi:cytochrome c oxidase subunit 3